MSNESSEASETFSFVYEQLPHGEIRLLHLETTEEPLQGRFTYTLPNQRTAYTVLSHTWTPRETQSSEPVCLWIGGRYIELDDNVAQFIFAQSLDENTLPLWIDAICIDQGNEEEKIQQIPMMDKIYFNAVHCVVWLGEAMDHIESAMRALPKINSTLEEFDIDPSTSHLSLNRAMSTELLLNMDGLCDIVTRTWFQRLWTMQEFVLAKDIFYMCGKATIAGSILNRFVDLFNLCNYHANEALMKPEMYVTMFRVYSPLHLSVQDAKQYNAFHRLPALQSLRNVRQEDQRTSAMALRPESALQRDLATLTMTFDKSASVAKDNILGLLGMLRLSEFQTVPVSTSTDEIDVFTAAVIAILRQQYSIYNMSLLHYTDTVDRLDGLPSWVPNFHSRQRLHVLSPLNKSGDNLYGAGIGETKQDGDRVRFACCNHNGLPTMIQIKGRIIDKVKAAIDGENTGWEDAEYVTHAGKHQQAWEQKCKNLARSHAKGQTTSKTIKYLDRYRSVLSAGSTKVGLSYKRSEPSEQTYSDFTWRLGKLADPEYNDFTERLHNSEHPGVKVNWDWLTGKSKDTNQPLYIGEEKEEYHARVFEVCRRRSFFVTANGSFGIGGRVAVGDTVVVFSDTRTPFLVREIERTDVAAHETPIYHLIGEAYVDDIMDGQAYRGVLGQALEDQWISLV